MHLSIFKAVEAITVNLFKKPVFLQASVYFAHLQPVLSLSSQQALIQLKGTIVVICRNISVSLSCKTEACSVVYKIKICCTGFLAMSYLRKLQRLHTSLQMLYLWALKENF